MLGNLSMQRSLIMGVPLSIVLPLQGSLTVVLGTTVNCFCSRRRMIHIFYLLASQPFSSQYFSRQLHISRTSENGGAQGCDGSASPPVPPQAATTQGSSSCCATWQPLLEEGATGRGHVEQSSVEAPSAASATAATATAAAGLVVAFCGGVCFGGFSPLFNLAVNDELGWIHNDPHGGKPLTVFNANLCFCAAFALSAWLVNLSLMRWPPGSQRVEPSRVPNRGLQDSCLCLRRRSNMRGWQRVSIYRRGVGRLRDGGPRASLSSCWHALGRLALWRVQVRVATSRRAAHLYVDALSGRGRAALPERAVSVSLYPRISTKHTPSL